MESDVILPDLQSAVLCEDVRCEINGMQTLVGVLNVIAAPALPINYLRLCIWARWCSGTGKFRQRSRIVGVDEQQLIAQAEVEFVLKEMEGHATPAIRNAPRGDLPGRRIAAAFSVAGDSDSVPDTLRCRINSLPILSDSFITGRVSWRRKRSRHCSVALP